MNAIKELFVVSRPISWLNTAYPFAATYLFFAQQIDIRLIIGTLFFLIPYNLMMYGVNDVYDYESDLRNPRKGGIEGALASTALHHTILLSSYILVGVFSIFITALANYVSTAILLCILFFVLAYSLPIFRFKERPFLDSLTSSIHFVGPMVYALSLVNFPMEAWPFVTAFILWGMASHAFGAVQDINADRAGKISSIATVIGAKKTVLFSFVLYLISSLILMFSGYLAAIIGIASLTYAANIYSYLNLKDKDAERSNKAWRRFIYLNLFTGFVITIVLIIHTIYS